MAATASTMLALGTQAPDFQLPDVVSGRVITLASFAPRKALLVMFLSRHCKYVKHVQAELARIGRDYAGADIGIVAICANDADAYPADAPESLRQQAEQAGFGFPYLHDATQATAKAYTAACTPDLFLFDAGRRLVYRGQIDDSRPGNERPVSGRDLRAAIDAVLADRQVDAAQRPSVGCNIKWRPGNEPEYYG